MVNQNYKLILGDCLTESAQIESGSVDLILTDLPYGTMQGQSRTGIYHQGEERHDWDAILPSKEVMNIANRILRKNGKMVLFAQSEFTFDLYNNAIPNLPYSYKMTWEKDSLGSFMRSQKAPLYQSEDILVFSKNHTKHDFEGMHPLRPYFKRVQDFIGKSKKEIIDAIGQRADHSFRTDSTQFSLCTEETYQALIDIFGINQMQNFRGYSALKETDTNYRQNLIAEMNAKYPSTFNLWEGKKYKSNILKYRKDYGGFHPTQKPVALLADLIKTFSNENDLVVDLTCGSGSTGVACMQTNRRFFGIEKEFKYFEIAKQRIEEAVNKQPLLMAV